MEKHVIRTENAPAPFQGAPYNQAIVAGELVFVAGQLGLKPGDTAVEGDIAEQTEQALRNLAAILEAAGTRSTPGEDERVPHGPRRLPGDERGLRALRRRPPAGAVDVPGREAAGRGARRDRGGRTPLERQRASLHGSDAPAGRISACRPRCAHTSAVSTSTPTSSAAPCATSCSGSRMPTRTFSSRASITPGLRGALEPHGRVEDMEVHGQLVGVRLHPRDRAVSALAPGGNRVHAAAGRALVGPGHRDFAIVSGPVRSRSRTTWRDATSRSTRSHGALSDGALVDPVRRASPISSAASCARSASTASGRIRCGSCAGCGSSPSSASSSPARRSRRCAREAPGLAHVSAERIGGGLAADGMGELSKLLLGREPARALRLARDTGVLELIMPEFAPAIGYALGLAATAAARSTSTCSRSSSTRADAGAPLEVLLAALLHDLGKPAADGTGASHAELGARDRPVDAARGFGTRPSLAATSSAIVAGHAFQLDRGATTRRRRSRRGGSSPARRRARATELVCTSAPISRARRSPTGSRRRSTRLARRARRRAGAARIGSPISRSTATT